MVWLLICRKSKLHLLFIRRDTILLLIVFPNNNRETFTKLFQIIFLNLTCHLIGRKCQIQIQWNVLWIFLRLIFSIISRSKKADAQRKEKRHLFPFVQSRNAVCIIINERGLRQENPMKYLFDRPKQVFGKQQVQLNSDSDSTECLQG